MLTFKVTKNMYYESTITTCTTLLNDDIILLSSKCRGVPGMRNARVQLLEPPNSPDLNPVDYSVWSVLQEMVYKTRITDLDDLQRSIRTEWANLDHAVIAAAVRQWRRRLSACVRAGCGYFEDAFNSDAFCDNFGL